MLDLMLASRKLKPSFFFRKFLLFASSYISCYIALFASRKQRKREGGREREV